MATGPSAYLIEKWLNAVFNNTSFVVTTCYMQLHDGDPGAAGTANVASETDRVAVSCSAAASPGIATDADLLWSNVTGTDDPSHYSLWDASSGGNFLGSGTITGGVYLAGGDYQINAGDWTLTMTPAS